MRTILLLALCFFASSSALACRRSASELLHLIQGGESARVVKESLAADDCETLIENAAASGVQDWIDAAVLLYEHTDAGWSEGLHDALGRAMQIAPARVLPLVNSSKNQTASTICLPWMLDDTGDTDDHYRHIVQRAKRMFERFLKTKYHNQAAACLVEIGVAERSFENPK